MSPLTPLEPEDPENRDTALLTKGYRGYLTGLKEEVSIEHETQLRLRIRKRIQNGIRDFRQIRRLSDKDKKLIFNDITTDSPLTEGIVHMLSFVYNGITQYTNMDFTTLLEAAIRTAEHDRLQDSDYSLSEVEVTIEPSYYRTISVEDLRKRLNEGEELADYEIGRLVRWGELTPEDLTQLEQTSDVTHEPSEAFYETDWLPIADYSDADME